MTNNQLLDLAIKKVAKLELEKNPDNNTKYRDGLYDAIQELKKLKTDEESNSNIR